jgi:hypothetical protein
MFSNIFYFISLYIGIVRSLNFILKISFEESIVNALYGLRITDQPFKSNVFTGVVDSQSTL